MCLTGCVGGLREFGFMFYSQEVSCHLADLKQQIAVRSQLKWLAVLRLAIALLVDCIQRRSSSLLDTNGALFSIGPEQLDGADDAA